MVLKIGPLDMGKKTEELHKRHLAEVAISSSIGVMLLFLNKLLIKAKAPFYISYSFHS